MKKFIFVICSFLVLIFISCSSNPSKNNDSETIIYFYENPSAEDELEAISFLNSSTILYSFDKGKALISMERWACSINKDVITINTGKNQIIGTFSEEKIVIDGKEFIRYRKPVKK
jgi:hypothetical protein